MSVIGGAASAAGSIPIAGLLIGASLALLIAESRVSRSAWEQWKAATNDATLQDMLMVRNVPHLQPGPGWTPTPR